MRCFWDCQLGRFFLFSDLSQLEQHLRKVKAELFAMQTRYEGVYEKAYDENMAQKKSAALVASHQSPVVNDSLVPSSDDASEIVNLTPINVGGEEPVQKPKASQPPKKQGPAFTEIMQSLKKDKRWLVDVENANFDKGSGYLEANFALRAGRSQLGKKQTGYIAFAVLGENESQQLQKGKSTGWFLHPDGLEFDQDKQIIKGFEKAEQFSIRRFRNFKQTISINPPMIPDRLVVISLDVNGKIVTVNPFDVSYESKKRQPSVPVITTQRDSINSLKQSH